MCSLSWPLRFPSGKDILQGYYQLLSVSEPTDSLMLSYSYSCICAPIHENKIILGWRKPKQTLALSFSIQYTDVGYGLNSQIHKHSWGNSKVQLNKEKMWIVLGQKLLIKLYMHGNTMWTCSLTLISCRPDTRLFLQHCLICTLIAACWEQLAFYRTLELGINVLKDLKAAVSSCFTIVRSISLYSVVTWGVKIMSIWIRGRHCSTLL